MILECQILCECDGCGEEESFDVNADNNGFNDLELKRAIAQNGWKIVSRSFTGPKMLCDSCKDKKED